jgi:hypothetical protein
MPDSTMRLLNCPACGGPLDPPAGQSSMKCLYCNNAVIIPESLRVPEKAAASQPSIFSGIDMSSMVGYGTQWAEVVRLAQSGAREQAVQKYMQLTGNNEESARYMVDNLGHYQSYAFDPGSYSSIHQVYAPVMSQAAESIKSATKLSLWIGCAITAFVFLILAVSLLPVLIGLFAGLMSLFGS